MGTIEWLTICAICLLVGFVAGGEAIDRLYRDHYLRRRRGAPAHRFLCKRCHEAEVPDFGDLCGHCYLDSIQKKARTP
jgi:hypothetical protein